MGHMLAGHLINSGYSSLTKPTMRNLEQQITQYAAYHRDRRNIATHFVGVPMIVFSVILALANILIGPVHLGWIGVLTAAIYYLVLDRPLGFAMAFYLFMNAVLASLIAAYTSTVAGLGLAAACFIIGWAIQFVGHKYEGMKPAFTDDLIGLVIGPLFVMTELFFMLGAKKLLKKYVEDRVGPVLAERNGATIGPAAHIGTVSHDA